MGQLITIKKSMSPTAMMQGFKLSALNLKRNSRRSVMSMVIIAIAVFALTSAAGFGLYTYESLRESTANDVGHLTLAKPGYFEQEEESTMSNGLSHGPELIKQVSALSNVKAVQPRIYFNGLISAGNKSTIFVGTGVDASEFDLKGDFIDIGQGEAISIDENTDNPQIMIAKELANNLRVNVGDWVTLLATTSDGALNAFDFEVQGIFSTGVPELDKRQIYISVMQAQDLLATEKISTLSVFLPDTSQTDTAYKDVVELMSVLSNDEKVEVTRWEQRAFFYEKVQGLYDRIFGIMGMVMGLVVFVSLFNTMTMSVTERTREIGTLAALGSYPREIILGFVRESVLLAIIGSLLGGLLAAFVTLMLKVSDIQMPPPPGRSEGYPLEIIFSPSVVWYSTLGVIAICVVAAFLSARKGINKPVTEALAYA
jgi:putative ABC transport system permease protein